MEQMQISLTEHAVLGLLSEGSAHGFALSKDLAAGSGVGRVLTVRQPLVYRALGRLVEMGFAEPASVEPGEAGPQRVVHRITSCGRRHLTSWLSDPVEHIRDLRVEFLLKLVFLHRSGASPLALVQGQRAALQETLAALENPADEPTEPVEIWWKHTAEASCGLPGLPGEPVPQRLSRPPARARRSRHRPGRRGTFLRWSVWCLPVPTTLWRFSQGSRHSRRRRRASAVRIGA